MLFIRTKHNMTSVVAIIIIESKRMLFIRTKHSMTSIVAIIIIESIYKSKECCLLGQNTA